MPRGRFPIDVAKILILRRLKMPDVKQLAPLMGNEKQLHPEMGDKKQLAPLMVDESKRYYGDINTVQNDAIRRAKEIFDKVHADVERDELKEKVVEIILKAAGVCIGTAWGGQIGGIFGGVACGALHNVCRKNNIDLKSPTELLKRVQEMKETVTMQDYKKFLKRVENDVKLPMLTSHLLHVAQESGLMSKIKPNIENLKSFSSEDENAVFLLSLFFFFL